MFKLTLAATLSRLLFPSTDFVRLDQNDAIAHANVGTTFEFIMGPQTIHLDDGRSPYLSSQTFLILTPEKRGARLGPVIAASICNEMGIAGAVAQLHQHHNGSAYKAVALTHNQTTGQKALDAIAVKMPHVNQFFVAQTTPNVLAAMFTISADGTITGMHNTTLKPYFGAAESGLARLELPERGDDSKKPLAA